MKKHLLSLLIGFISPFAFATVTTLPVMPEQDDKELAWVDEQIQAILPARIGVPDGYINSLKDPMKMKKVVAITPDGSKLLAPPKLGSGIPVIVEEPLRLQAIINKSVLISGKWYKPNDSVRNYTLNEIKPNSVLLTSKKNQKLILFLTKQNSNIKITTK